ncbi:MAG: CoA-binding protein [Bacteroidetes bacterium]|nr:CoA-binding protein [Bacteroidota bacterium]
MENKRTLVIGASTNPARYSHMAIHSLQKHENDVVALAKRSGKVADISIQTELPTSENIHTVTLYIGSQRQPEYYNYLLELNPKRLIFNPGTENNELVEKLKSKGIETFEACTLVMLSTGQY